MMLTPGQFRVARMYAAGLSYAEIARRLHLHANTPSTIVSRVRLRLGVHERRDIAAMLERCEVRSRQGRASRHGWSHGDTVRIVGGPWAG
ncbi:MAG TPA: helix-turn-helix transcriptional regulator, partial [Burkholderiales bacterium]|nr:helix-turn-helix transcriptional regulator [Burkholderiales bacterium]